MRPAAVATLLLGAVGVALITLGAWMTLRDWQKKREGQIGTRPESLGETLQGLAKVLEALKAYPVGQRLIVFGIIVLVIAGILGGTSGGLQ
jgi:hypothetical protein